MSIKFALHDVLTGVIYTCYTHVADRSGSAVQGMGLRPLACCGCGYAWMSLSCEWCVLSGSVSAWG